MRVFGIVGHKDSGKTHLVVRLVGELGRRGLRVSTIKHTHHHEIELEPPGKDSARHRAAGAHEVIVASESGWTLVRQQRLDSPPLADLLAELAPCDVVLVEGYKQQRDVPRVEVFRGGEGRALLAGQDPGILAVACPVGLVLATPARAQRLDLDDTAGIADFLLAHRR